MLYTNSKKQINIVHETTAFVYADKDRIGQAMINLMTNAMKYSPNADQIKVTIHPATNNHIAFSVEDRGIGISTEDQKRIFERFYRADGVDEQTYPGFGIGLFIVKEFIQKHNGEVLFKSEKGKGSIFTFTLPMHSNGNT